MDRKLMFTLPGFIVGSGLMAVGIGMVFLKRDDLAQVCLVLGLAIWMVHVFTYMSWERPSRKLNVDEETPVVLAGREMFLRLLRTERPRQALAMLEEELDKAGVCDLRSKQIVMEWASSTDAIVTGRTMRWLVVIFGSQLAVLLVALMSR